MEDCEAPGLDLGYVVCSYSLSSRIDIIVGEAVKCCLAEYPREKKKALVDSYAVGGTVGNFPNVE